MPTALREFIKQARRASIDPSTGQAYTQEGLGEAVGISGKSVESIENGRTKTIGPKEASRFARALGVTVADICRAMGYEVEAGDLSTVEREMVALLRRVPAEIQEDFLEATRQDAKGAIAMYRRLKPQRR